MKSDSMSMPEKLLRKKEVSERFSVSTRTIERAVSSGRLKAIKILGAVRFCESDIIAIINGSGL